MRGGEFEGVGRLERRYQFGLNALPIVYFPTAENQRFYRVHSVCCQMMDALSIPFRAKRSRPIRSRSRPMRRAVGRGALYVGEDGGAIRVGGQIAQFGRVGLQIEQPGVAMAGDLVFEQLVVPGAQAPVQALVVQIQLVAHRFVPLHRADQRLPIDALWHIEIEQFAQRRENIEEIGKGFAPRVLRHDGACISPRWCRREYGRG